MLSVIMLSAVMLNVVVPCSEPVPYLPNDPKIYNYIIASLGRYGKRH
jgi:hypothetical protein